jgi:hypothetical protein
LLLDPATFGGALGSASGAHNDARETAGLLAGLGVPHYVVTPDLLNKSEVQPAWQESWEWEVLDSGRVVPVGQSHDVAWRVLA